MKDRRLMRLIPLSKILTIRDTIKNKYESITSDELLLFKPNILQAIDYIHEKKRPDTNAIYET